MFQEKHNNEYETIQKKTYTEKVDFLTAQLVGKEEALAICERNLSSLQECIRLQNESKVGNISSLLNLSLFKLF